MSILKRICLAAVATGVICVGVASAQSDPRDEASCRANPFPSCTRIGEELRFSMKTGRNTAPGGAEPFWSVNGGPATVITHPSWQQNLQAGWITPSASASGASYADADSGTYTYLATVWMEDDPYFFDKIALNLKLGADNTIVAVRVNGVVVLTGNGGSEDFKAANFDTLGLPTALASQVFRKGCNIIEIETYNSGGPTGLSVGGQITAVCSKCTSPRQTGIDLPSS
jgi:hypothetical protein